MWCKKHEIEEENDTETENNDMVDPITQDELKQALNELKKTNKCGLDGLTSELLKYGDTFFQLRFLHLLNECCKKQAGFQKGTFMHR